MNFTKNSGDARVIQLENLNWNVTSHDKAKLQNVFNFNNHCSNSNGLPKCRSQSDRIHRVVGNRVHKVLGVNFK